MGLRRRFSSAVSVGQVTIGGTHPIAVQSMTNTDTADVSNTVNQIKDLSDAGSELVRVTVNTEAAAQAVPLIVSQLRDQGYNVPVIGDFHYNGHLLLTKYPQCASALAKYRINPGNSDIGKEEKNNFETMIKAAVDFGKPVRIGANWGSLDKTVLAKLMDSNSDAAPSDEILEKALIRSALESAELALKYGLKPEQLILSAKVSKVPSLLRVYRELARSCRYPLHLGLTEAGSSMKGIANSAVALGTLLQEGIGDTIRVSLTPAPGGSRTEEVKVARQILQALEIRNFEPQVTSCPGCGRTTSTLFQSLAEEIQDYLRERMAEWKVTRPSAAQLNVAVMGCIVNGPGESKHAHLGISLPGTAEDPKAPIYVDGKLLKTVQGAQIVPEFKRIIESYVENHF